VSAQRGSIVIPLLKQPDEFLTRCVRSAVDQTVPAEVIVVRSEPTPKSNLAILENLQRRHGGLRVIDRDGPSFAEGLNSGFKAATTSRVGILLGDDWLHPAALERCLAYETDIVSTGLAVYSADGETPTGIQRDVSRERYLGLETDQARASYMGHFFLFQRDLLLQVGGVDPEIGDTGPDDYDLIWTLLEHDATVTIVEEVLYYIRDHPGERLTLRDRDAQVADLEKIFDKHGVHGEVRADLIQRHSRWYGRQVQDVMREKRESS